MAEDSPTSGTESPEAQAEAAPSAPVRKSYRPLERRTHEKALRHRALLLYTMMDEKLRSYRHVGRVLRKGDKTIRRWAEEEDWAERIDRAGVGAQSLAIREYGQCYPETLAFDAIGIEPKMSVPFKPTMPPPPVASTAKDAKDPHEPAPGPAQKFGLRAELHDRTKLASDKMKTTRGFASLLVGLLGQAAKDLQQGKTKVNARDVPGLVKAYYETQSLLEGTPTSESGPQLTPSVRVQQAERLGTDIAEAMLQDARECVAILQGIQASKSIAVELEQQREEAQSDHQAHA